MKVGSRLISPLIILLFVLAIYELTLVGERAVSAAFNVWKFGRSDKGIDVGAYSSVYFLGVNIFGMAACAGASLFSAAISERVQKWLKIVWSIFVLDALLYFGLIAAGMAFLNCGR